MFYKNGKFSYIVLPSTHVPMAMLTFPQDYHLPEPLGEFLNDANECHMEGKGIRKIVPESFYRIYVYLTYI